MPACASGLLDMLLMRRSFAIFSTQAVCLLSWSMTCSPKSCAARDSTSVHSLQSSMNSRACISSRLLTHWSNLAPALAVRRTHA